MSWLMSYRVQTLYNIIITNGSCQKENADHVFEVSKAKKPKEDSDLGKPLEDLSYKVLYLKNLVNLQFLIFC